MKIHRQITKLLSKNVLNNNKKIIRNQPHQITLQNINQHKKYFFSTQKIINPSPQNKQSKSSQNLPTFTQLQCKNLIQQPNPLREIILQSINKFGQIKVDKYWKLALTDSEFGYYRQSNVFSKEGDFTTSPQISPLFGQMVAVWIVYFLNKVGIIDQNTQTVTKKFRLVQFGPGRGLFMKDIVKALHDMKVDNYFEINFVQVSQYNRKCQQQNIFDQFKKYDQFFKFEYENVTKQIQVFTNENQFKDIKLKWFQNFQLLVKQDYDALQAKKQLPVTIFLMNQFFDALPTNILEFTQKGWRQKVFKKSTNPQFPLQLKNSTNQIPQKMRPIIKDPKIGDRIQVSYESLITIDTMTKLMKYTKGAILNIDYGAQMNFSNSIRAIKNHKFIPEPHFWQVPGKCDLSAYVNFGALADFAQINQGIKAFQAIPQGYFLQAMGINPRIQILQKNMNQKQKDRIESQYQRLTHPQQMGETFKVQCISLKQYGELYPWITQKQGVY